ncbi:MAG: ammonium transporter [Planctomycetaceae bacterium]
MFCNRTAVALVFVGLILSGSAISSASAQPELTPPTFDDSSPFDEPAEPGERAELTEPAADEPAAADVPAVTDETAFAVDNFFVFVCAALVLLMQAGFAMVEAGFNGSKHTVNILFKSVSGMAVGALIFFLIGYHLMYPVSPLHENVLGELSPGIDSSQPIVATEHEAAWRLAGGVNFLFHAALAVTAAAIVSGAVAGRMRFGAYLISAAIVAGFVVPIIGYWTWGLGWLDDIGFQDFAGGGVVHMTGGFIGLAGAVMLGPRIGRYTPDGKPIAIPGHSLPLATLGVFLMLIGWYGFNPGHQLGIIGEASTLAVATIAVNTTLAACAGGVLSTSVSWFLFGKPDLSMALNGLLGGLVGVTASCNGVTNLEAIVIGAVAGVVVVAAIILLDKLQIDDPVGAFPVHGICGMWGLIACSIFGDAAIWGNVGGDAAGPAYGNWTAQIVGILAIAGFSFGCMAMLFALLKGVEYLRVSPEDEQRGLDFSEHGMSAYAA